MNKNVWFWKYRSQVKLLPQGDTLELVLCSVFDGIVYGKLLYFSVFMFIVVKG